MGIEDGQHKVGIDIVSEVAVVLEQKVPEFLDRLEIVHRGGWYLWLLFLFWQKDPALIQVLLFLFLFWQGGFFDEGLTYLALALCTPPVFPNSYGDRLPANGMRCWVGLIERLLIRSTKEDLVVVEEDLNVLEQLSILEVALAKGFLHVLENLICYVELSLQCFDPLC